MVYKFVIVTWDTLHTYRSLHACLPPPDIQQVTPQPTSPSSIKASEQYCNTPGSDGEGITTDIRIVTGQWSPTGTVAVLQVGAVLSKQMQSTIKLQHSLIWLWHFILVHARTWLVST